jgi:hypothetical protein
VIYQPDAHGRLPVGISISHPAGGAQSRTEVRFATASGGQADLTGAIPKAVPPHELRFAPWGGLWRCHVTVDT